MREVLAVILRFAQNLSVRRARPFAEFTLSAVSRSPERSEGEGLRVTASISKYLREDSNLDPPILLAVSWALLIAIIIVLNREARTLIDHSGR